MRQSRFYFFSSTFGTLAERLALRRYDKAQTAAGLP